MALMVISSCTLKRANDTTLSLTTEPNVSQCLPLGSVHVVHLDEGQADIEQEAILLSKARQKAIPLGGDTLVASGPLREGGQFFSVYRCRDLPRTEPPVLGVEVEKTL